MGRTMFDFEKPKPDKELTKEQMFWVYLYYNDRDLFRKLQKEYYKKNKEKIAEYRKTYYDENKEKALELQKIYREENKEKIAKRMKKYREENKEKIAEYRKNYNEEHKEEIRENLKKYGEKNKERLKKYRQEHKEEIQEKKKEWYEKDKEKLIIQNRLHRRLQTYNNSLLKNKYTTFNLGISVLVETLKASINDYPDSYPEITNQILKVYEKPSEENLKSLLELFREYLSIGLKNKL